MEQLIKDLVGSKGISTQKLQTLANELNILMKEKNEHDEIVQELSIQRKDLENQIKSVQDEIAVLLQKGPTTEYTTTSAPSMEFVVEQDPLGASKPSPVTVKPPLPVTRPEVVAHSSTSSVVTSDVGVTKDLTVSGEGKFQIEISKSATKLLESRMTKLNQLRNGLPTESVLRSMKFKKTFHPLDDKDARITSLAVQNNEMVLGTSSGAIKWDLKRNNRLNKLGSGDNISQLSLMYEDTGISYGTNNGWVRFYHNTDMPSSTHVYNDRVSGIRFHPTNKFIYSSSVSGNWAVSDIETSSVITKKFVGSAINSLDVSPNGAIIALGCSENGGSIRLFDIRQDDKGEVLASPGILSPRFLPDFRHLVSTHRNGIQLFDLKNMNAANGLSCSLIDMEPLECVAVDKSGTFVACGTSNGIRVFRTNSLKQADTGKSTYEFNLTNVPMDNVAGKYSSLIFSENAFGIYASNGESISHFANP